MTLVNIDLRNQGYETSSDDRVVFYSLLVREGDFGTISTAPVEVELADGKASVDLAPGPVGVQIIAGQVADTRVKEGRVPMEGPTTLNVVLTLFPEYSDAIRTQFLAAIHQAQDTALTRIDAEVAVAVDAEMSGVTDMSQEALSRAKNAEGVAATANVKSTSATSTASTAASTASNAIDRVTALEAMGGLSPESPVDGQTANLISQPGTLTRSAVSTAVESVVDGRYLPTDPTYGLVPRLVYHGTDSSTPRPATDSPVIWLGIPLPAHSRPGDVLMRPAGSEADWAPDWLNLVGWYDPSSLTPGSTVTYVGDRSGHGNHLDITGGTGAITVNEGALAHPALSFDGASWISSGLLSQGQWTHPTTVWVVVASDEVVGDAMSIFDSASAPIPNKSVVFISNYGRFSAGAGVNLFGTEVVPVGTPTLLMVNFAGDPTSSGEINGVQSFGPTDLGDGRPDSHRLGANGAGANPFKGAIGEVIIASGATASERESITTYLMEKWGIV